MLPDVHLSVFVRSIVGLIFLAAALSKLQDISVFRGILRGYDLLPARLVYPTAWLLPSMEIITASCLLFDALMPWPYLAAGALFFLFGCAVAINLLRGRTNIPCGCFGKGREHHLTWVLVIRNVAFGGLTAGIVITKLKLNASNEFWVASYILAEPVSLSTMETIVTMLLAFVVLSVWPLRAALLELWSLSEGENYLSSEGNQRGGT